MGEASTGSDNNVHFLVENPKVLGQLKLVGFLRYIALWKKSLFTKTWVPSRAAAWPLPADDLKID